MKYSKALVCLTFFAFLSPGAGKAMEHLRFNDAISQRVATLIQAEFDKEKIEIAAADLNADGIPEYIVREIECLEPCEYTIYADTANKLIKLGHIKANKLVLSDKETKGVRSFFAYQSDLNDYKPSEYQWDALSSQYTMRQKGILP